MIKIEYTTIINIIQVIFCSNILNKSEHLRVRIPYYLIEVLKTLLYVIIRKIPKNMDINLFQHLTLSGFKIS